MKNLKFLTLTLVLGLLMTANVFAQGRNISPEESAKRQTERLKSELALSDQQASTIEQLNLERSEKMKALRTERSEDREKNRAQMREIQQEWDAQVMAVLNPDQKEKYQALKEERAQRRGERSGDIKNKPYKSKRGSQSE